MSLARLSVRNPVPVNLLMLAIIAIGVVSLARLPRELMSDVSFNWVFIIKPYPGVSAEEIEKLITVPIENEIRDVKGIDSIASQSTEGACFISVKFEQMSDEEFRARLQEIRTEVDKVTDLPEDALDTRVQSFGSGDFAPLISVHLYGDASEKTLVDLARQLRDELLLVPKVAKAELVGVRDREIWVEADPARMQGYALTPAELQAAIRAHGVNVPAGKMDSGRREMLVRSIGEFDDPSQIRKVIVRALPDGRAIRVEDVATVSDTFAKPRTRARLDLAPVVSLTITKSRDGNSIDIIDEVKRIGADFEKRQHGTVRVGFTQDSSEMIRDILDKLTTNAWLGFAVVVLLLLLVLGLRNAVLAALGIPLSFLGCFIFMHYMGESFNSNSLFGLVLVLGIIVDDAIIIVENCYRHLQMGKSWRQAAIDGTEEVTRPILSATATTIAAFLPLVLLPGIVGKFMRIIPITVSLALVASMVEAFVILPSHFADWPGRRLQRRTDKPWLSGLQAQYVRALRYIVRRRYRFVAIMLLAVPAAAALIPLVGRDLFAGEDINTFQVRVRMPTGTSLQTTSKTLGAFEEAARTLPDHEVRAVHATAGLVMTDTDWIFRSDVGQLWLDLSLSYDRERSADEIMADLRGKVQRIVGPTNIQLAKLNTGPPVGKPVEVKLEGKYLPDLQAAAEELESYLRSIEGVRDVDNDFRAGTDEVRVRIDPDRAALHGLSVGQVGLLLRASLDGVEAGSLHDGDEEIDIVVRVAERLFERPEDVMRLPLPLRSGKSITVADVATYTAEPSYAEIRRFRNQRAITLSADLDKDKTDIVVVNDQLQKKFDELATRYRGINLDFGGEFQEFKETFNNIAQLFLIGVLLIYLILGAQFRSYVQPVVILFTVPFAFVGAMVGLVVSGNPFSVVTMFGMVALAGVAVNDAIVLISFANDARAAGMSAEDAVVEAGRLRLRPVILTSATTVAGLLPMAMGVGGMSLTWGPLANTIVWGLWVATALTLFFIPAVYLVVVHDIADSLRRRLGLEEDEAV
ncbi:MAG: efflux RND transporter permease subunit [Deltaproteobacteria bacterium]|jgi:multidrug efflux pump subunit AcrB|nr:efflux RND transporter permease subunit [Deltaproteobacteria bacterium]MBW2533637.1 efflux RND transporter permease subunit [Deltaproteobacteria bacterium]